MRVEHIGDATLYLADCMSVLPTLEARSVDAVITDPPYGNGTKYIGYDDTPENLIQLINLVLPEMLRVSRVVAITCGVNNICKYPPSTWVLSWYSPNSNGYSPWGFSCWQPILVYGKDPYLAHGMGCRPDSFQHSSLRHTDIDHPCPKPIEVMEKIVRRVTMDGTTVLDPFMGSGTTLIAATKLGRKSIGIEINEDYFNIAVKRVTEAHQQLRLPLGEI